jgi:Ca2+/H+ antiporter
VKASLIGSIVGNILLVFGLSAVLGGVKYSTQKFNKTAASMGTTMLTLAVIGLAFTALFHVVTEGNPNAASRNSASEIAVILMLTHVLRSDAAPHRPAWSFPAGAQRLRLGHEAPPADGPARHCNCVDRAAPVRRNCSAEGAR